MKYWNQSPPPFSAEATIRSLALLNAEQLSAEEQKIATFQERIAVLVPALFSASLKRTEWIELISRSETQHVVSLSSTFIFITLSEIRQVAYDDLVTSLSKKLPPRGARPLFATPQEPIKRKNYHQDDDDSQNPLILASMPANEALHSPMRKKGVRIVELAPASPERGYSDVRRTPGKTKVHGIFSNNEGSFFKPLSPYKAFGMVNIEGARREKIESALPRLRFERSESAHFTATLPQLLDRQGATRRIGQNTLMRASCREVFAAHGAETIIKSHGSDYHWSHLIAHFLGGEQGRENLVPATAASNYNTLELVEQFISRKLSEEKVTSIEIKVDPIYSGDSLIPDELVFHLSWEDARQSCVETTRINPRSYQRVTKSMQSSIALLREKADAAILTPPSPSLFRIQQNSKKEPALQPSHGVENNAPYQPSAKVLRF